MPCVSDPTTDPIQPPKAGSSPCCKSNGSSIILSKHGMSNTLPKSRRKPQRKPLPKIRQTICSATKPKSSKPKPLPSAPNSKQGTNNSVFVKNSVYAPRIYARPSSISPLVAYLRPEDKLYPQSAWIKPGIFTISQIHTKMYLHHLPIIVYLSNNRMNVFIEII